MVKAVGMIKDATKQLGKAVTQVTEVYQDLRNDEDSIGGQSHAQLGRIVSGGSGVAFCIQCYIFARLCPPRLMFVGQCLL